jgi:arsenate reductase
MTVTIYHNPKCSTSRNVLALIRERGIEPAIIEYLKTPLTKTELQTLIAKMGVPVRDVVRWKEKDMVAAAGIAETSNDGALLDAMVAHPILMNRPIVVVASDSVGPRAKLCRPSETVAEVV